MVSHSPHGCAPTSGAAGKDDEAAAPPPGYTSPSKAPAAGGAPSTRYRVVDGGQNGRPRVWAIVMLDGDEAMSGLSDWMKAEGVRGAHLRGIGALSSATFGWYDLDKRAYKNIPVQQQVECVSFIGDVGTAENGEPALHVHGAVALPDGSMKGGHVLEAYVSPTMEIFAAESGLQLNKAYDERSGLELFRL